MRVVVFGGDGFCGWPTALHLSANGHEVVIVDNLLRRQIDTELEVESLTPIRALSERVQAWAEVSGRRIDVERVDVARDYPAVEDVIRRHRPDAVVHFAEQRAAPYSMRSGWHKRFTVENNLPATHNVLLALVQAGVDAHLVHLGTMGVYGYGSAGVTIPEGYLTVQVPRDDGNTQEQEILYPPTAGSVYHMTKTQDHMFFRFYNKNDGLRITDLHQGIVWGTQTDETRRDARLINRFDYDGDFGTVLNRFLMQAAVGHPITVHGTGGQTRAFIHIRDTAHCVRLAVETPPDRERVRVLNQMAESLTVRDLAELVAERYGGRVAYQENPRNEAAENDLRVANNGLRELGHEPTRLREGLLDDVAQIAEAYKHRVDMSRIPSQPRWTSWQTPTISPRASTKSSSTPAA